MSIQPSATERSPRQHVTDWFVGHFDSCAVLSVDTLNHSRYQLTILAGSAGQRPVHGDTFKMRRAWVIRNDEYMSLVAYVGFHLPTARFGFFNASMEYLGSSSSISGYPTITPTPSSL